MAAAVIPPPEIHVFSSPLQAPAFGTVTPAGPAVAVGTAAAANHKTIPSVTMKGPAKRLYNDKTRASSKVANEKIKDKKLITPSFTGTLIADTSNSMPNSGGIVYASSSSSCRINPLGGGMAGPINFTLPKQTAHPHVPIPHTTIVTNSPLTIDTMDHSNQVPRVSTYTNLDSSSHSSGSNSLDGRVGVSYFGSKSDSSSEQQNKQQRRSSGDADVYLNDLEYPTDPPSPTKTPNINPINFTSQVESMPVGMSECPGLRKPCYYHLVPNIQGAMLYLPMGHATLISLATNDETQVILTRISDAEFIIKSSNCQKVIIK